MTYSFLMWMGRVRLAMAVFLCATVSLSCGQGRCNKEIVDSGLSPSLCKLEGLATLKLPSSTRSLSWLSSLELRELDVTGARIDSFKGLPASLEVLTAPATGVAGLEHLPAGLLSLDISRTAVRNLDGLPDSLQSLRAMDVTFGGSAELPNLGELRLELQNRELQDLKELPRRLKILEISASGQGGVVSAAGRPAGLENLHIALARSQLFDLPPTLRHLTIIGPSDFDPVDLPTDLVSLHLVRYRPRSSLAGAFPYLRTLRLEEVPVGPLQDLPQFLESLELVEARVQSLEGLPSSLQELRITQAELAGLENLNRLEHLRVLGLNGLEAQELPVLPEEIEELYLRGAKVGSIQNIPPSVEKLDLSLSGVRPQSLSEQDNLRELVWKGYPAPALVSLPGDLKILVLAGSRGLKDVGPLPRKLEELDISSTGVRELPELPETLRSLKVQDTAIRSLEGLPASLESLSVTVHPHLDLGSLPPNLRELFLYDPGSR